jgi:putative phage-type endonuclease
MNKTVWIDLEQGSPEWLALRRTKIGSSDSYTIMGLNPWSGINTPLKLWESKIKGTESEVNYAMAFGTANEPKARKAFEKELGIKMIPRVGLNADRSWQIASLDGISEDNAIAVELKCGGESLHEKSKAKDISEHYYCQIQHQYATTGVEVIYFASYYEGDLRKFIIDRDNKYIAKLIDEESVFHENFINLIPPEMCERDYEDLSTSKAFTKKEKEWLEVHQQLKAIQDQEEILRKDMIGMTNNRSTRGILTKWSRITQKGNVDYKAIPELKGVNLDLYRKAPITKWMPSVIQKV